MTQTQWSDGVCYECGSDNWPVHRTNCPSVARLLYDPFDDPNAWYNQPSDPMERTGWDDNGYLCLTPHGQIVY